MAPFIFDSLSMLIFSNTPIQSSPSRGPQVQADADFQLGEVYLVKYQDEPVIVTVTGRSTNLVDTNLFGVSETRFRQCVLFRLGRRVQLWGYWLPWFKCRPERVTGDGHGIDWVSSRCSLSMDATHHVKL